MAKGKFANALAKHMMSTTLSRDALAFKRMEKSTRDFLMRALSLVESVSEESVRHAETKAERRASALRLAEAKRLHSLFTSSSAIRSKR